MKIIETTKKLYDLKKYESWKHQWNDSDKIAINDYIMDFCHPEDLLIYSKIFYPNFISVENCIILKDRYVEENFLQWQKELNRNTHMIEKTLNHTHIYDIFGKLADDVSDSIFEQLSDIINMSWDMILKRSFPDKTFTVETIKSDMEYGPVVTFYQTVSSDCANNDSK